MIIINFLSIKNETKIQFKWKGDVSGTDVFMLKEYLVISGGGEEKVTFCRSDTEKFT